MSAAPVFSVIIPSYNSGGKIAATIQSALEQSDVLLEVLVIDGSSTDGTPAFLEGINDTKGRLRILSEPDAGIYDAMNKGIRLARGRFLYFLGAGDVLRPGVLTTVADQLPAVDGRLEFIYGDVNWPAYGGIYGGAFTAARLGKENICHQAIFYDRGIFERLGKFDLAYKICADYAMNIRCFSHPAIRKTHLDLVVADFEGGGVSASIDRRFYGEIISLVWRHLGPRAGLQALYHHPSHFRWTHGLNYHLRQPLRTLPSRMLQLARRPFS